ncbi:MAG: hypothetical protein J6C62_09815 [Clostridia bacterium]|nr:hypothetical protein [Clostridia bacterium]
MKKKFLAMAMGTMLLLSQLAACGLGSTTDAPPATGDKVITVAIQDSGNGTQFLYDLKDAYEALHPGTIIDVVIDNSNLNSGDHPISNGHDEMGYDLIYCENGFNDYQIYGHKLLDITDIYSLKVYDENYNYVGEGGTVSLNDRMTEDLITKFNIGTKEKPQYKALPWYSYLYGAWYDADLFKQEELYSLPGYKGLDCIEGNKDDNLGPDGVEGTYDDGLPATWEDMKVLLQTMVDPDYNIVPFTWSGKWGYMRTNWLDSIVATYEGVDDMYLNYTWDGVDSDFGKITPENAYLLQKQTGKYAALKVAEYLIQNGMHSATSFDSSQNHTGAQEDYLNSVITDKRSAFLIDGNYWTYEAREYFAAMAKNVSMNYSRKKRNFKFFPFPKFIGTEGIPNQTNTKTIARVSVGACMVPMAGTEDPDLVKDFLLFTQSTENQLAFVKINDLMPSLKTSFSDEQKDSLSTIAKSTLEVINDKNTAIFLPGDSFMPYEKKIQTARYKMSSYLTQFDWYTLRDSNYQYDPLRTMYFDIKNNEAKPMNADRWFAGLNQGNYSEATWKEYLRTIGVID